MPAQAGLFLSTSTLQQLFQKWKLPYITITRILPPVYTAHLSSHLDLKMNLTIQVRRISKVRRAYKRK